MNKLKKAKQGYIWGKQELLQCSVLSAVRSMNKIYGSTEDGTNFALENQGGLHSRKD